MKRIGVCIRFKTGHHGAIVINWEAVGAISEIVGAIAIVVSLIYLALQIKHSRASANSSNVQNAIQSFNPINTAVGSDSSLARIVNRGVSDFDSLNEEERAQYSYLQRTYLNCFQNIFTQYKLGALSAEQWLPYAHEVAFLLSKPGPKAFRMTNRMYDEMFKAVEAMHLDVDHLDLDLVSRAPLENDRTT